MAHKSWRWRALLLSCALTTSVFSEHERPPLIITDETSNGPTELLFEVTSSDGQIIDQPLVIECEADGLPVPTYSWQKDGEPLQWSVDDSRIVQLHGQGTLNITRPASEDEGTYVCQATNLHGTATSGWKVVRQAYLNTPKKPQLVKIVALEGDQLVLKCGEPKQGYPKPDIFWARETTGLAPIPINHLSRDSRLTVGPEGYLYFANVTLEDASKDSLYVCMAGSDFIGVQKVIRRVHLSVVAMPTSQKNCHYNRWFCSRPTRQFVSEPNVIARVGATVRMWCLYGGSPTPGFNWDKLNGWSFADFETGRITWDDAHARTLVIKNITLDDASRYMCGTKVIFGTHFFNLSVVAAPHFTTRPQSRTTVKGQTVVLQCVAAGVPQPDISWLKNGRTLHEERWHVSSNGSVLTLKDVGIADTAVYGCRAVNNVDRVYAEAYVNVLPDGEVSQLS